MAIFHTKTFIKHDDYMTPKYAWENILHLIPKDKIIWEAFYGDGNSGDYLRELGLNVIHEPIDFFTQEPAHWDMIISNPPFSQAKEILKKLKQINKPFILLLPSSKLNTQYIRELYKNTELQIIIPKKRINFIKLINGNIPDGWIDRCNFDCFYYCYKMNFEKDIIWLEE